MSPRKNRLGGSQSMKRVSTLSQEDLSIFCDVANRFFLVQLGNWANQKSHELLKQQKFSNPLSFTSGRIQVMATEYGGIVRRAAARLTVELAQAIGIRKGLTTKRLRWIEQQAQEFIARKTSEEAANAIFTEVVSSLFTLSYPLLVQETFAVSVNGLLKSGLLMRDTHDEIRKAEARFGIKSESKLDGSKKAVFILLTTSPSLTTKQICAKLDGKREHNAGIAPLPAAWQRRGGRSWIDAYEKFPGSVKTYVTGVRKMVEASTKK